MRSNAYTSDSGRSRASSYTSPKAFMPKQPQIIHNYKNLSHEKLFLREKPREVKLFAQDLNEGQIPLRSENIMEIDDFMESSDKNGALNDIFLNTNSNNHENLQASKAYINAMKALQSRNKNLEDEKKELENQREANKENYEKQIRELEDVIKEKTSLFKNLENNLKEKLLCLEEENMALANQNKLLDNEQLLIKEEKEKQTENYNRSLRDCLSEKNELKTALKIYEDKLLFVKQENETLGREIQNLYSTKQKNEESITNLQEKINQIQEALKVRSLENEREREKYEEKVRSIEEYYEKLLEQELNEKQEIYRELNEIKMDYENLVSKYHENQQNQNDKDKQNLALQEKIDHLTKESSQFKQFAEYTQEINEKLINNFINESMTNINFSKIKTPEMSVKSIIKSPKTKDPKKDRLFTLENQERQKTVGREMDFYEKKKLYRSEYEATILAISEMEKELNDLIQKYHEMSVKINFDKNSRETTFRLQNEMIELNEIISNIRMELKELKRNEERLSLLAK